jgi:hypothetical protein
MYVLVTNTAYANNEAAMKPFMAKVHAWNGGASLLARDDAEHVVGKCNRELVAAFDQAQP